MGNRCNQIRMKKYQARRRRRAWLMGLLAVVLLIAGVMWLNPLEGGKQWLLQPSPTLTPEEAAWQERDIALPGKTWYALQLGIFEQQSAADALAEEFQNRGAGGYVQKTPQGYRVLAAAYDLRTDAVNVQSNLNTYHQVETFVTEIVCPDVKLRVKGQQAQLDALSSAYEFVNQAAEEFMHLSVRWDQGEIDKTELADALVSQQKTAENLAGQLVRFFDETDEAHAAAADLKHMLTDIAAILQRTQSENGNTALSAHMKEAQLTCLCRMQDHVQMLEAEISSR